METTLTVSTDDFQTTIDEYLARGFRLLMVSPAEKPSQALLEFDSDLVRVRCDVATVESASDSNWTIGRAGMMYRDLIPDRLGGKLIASHIRILNGGPVPDSVHYHKIDFQVIYCLKGAIEVVYEDQGPPFWLRPGDCVLQPPEIRHRVLEAEAGSEVIELTSPAEHETWFDHDLALPTEFESHDRRFGNHTFVIHRRDDVVWNDSEDGLQEALTNIGSAGQKAPQVTVLRSEAGNNDLVKIVKNKDVRILVGGRGLRLEFPRQF